MTFLPHLYVPVRAIWSQRLFLNTEMKMNKWTEYISKNFRHCNFWYVLLCLELIQIAFWVQND